MIVAVALSGGGKTASAPANVVAADPAPPVLTNDPSPSSSTSESTSRPPARPTSTPATAPTATSTAAPIATEQPAPPVATIAFARGHDATSNAVSLIDEQSEFRAGREIAWRVELASAIGAQTLRVTVADEASGRLVIDESFAPEPGSNVFYGQTVLATEPGAYVMRYYAGTALLGEGAFSIRQPEAPEITPKPQRAIPNPPSNPEPNPTKKPRSDTGNCDPSYPTVCIPPYPPDLDCGDVPYNDFKVRGRDDHGFDGDNDGWGCES